MFDHVGLNVQDYAASRGFYERALAPLGYSVVMSFDELRGTRLVLIRRNLAPPNQRIYR